MTTPKGDRSATGSEICTITGLPLGPGRAGRLYLDDDVGELARRLRRVDALLHVWESRGPTESARLVLAADLRALAARVEAAGLPVQPSRLEATLLLLRRLASDEQGSFQRQLLREAAYRVAFVAGRES